MLSGRWRFFWERWGEVALSGDDAGGGMKWAPQVIEAELAKRPEPTTAKVLPNQPACRTARRDGQTRTANRDGQGEPPA